MDVIELFKCEWFVNADGHTIENGCIVPLGRKATVYNPFDYTALFMDFANIKDSDVRGDGSITDDAMIEFANRYGLLFHFDNSMPRSKNENTVQAWKYHIVRMARNIQLWHSGQTKKALEYPEPYLNLRARIDPFTSNLELWTDSLISAMYMQLAQAVSGNKKYRQCAWCKSSFEITPRIARTNRMFCSNACKQADYRHRNKEK
jgi:hypothetical protein